MSNLFLALAMFAAPQVPLLSSGVHSLTLQRAGGPPIHYALSIPPGYSPKNLPRGKQCSPLAGYKRQPWP
jgi:hypothetical protein